MDQQKAYLIVGKIACMGCLCSICSSLQSKVLSTAKSTNNPLQAIKVILEYDGMICGAVEVMINLANEWENKNV